MKINKRVIVLLLAASAILAGVLTVIRLQRQPDAPEVAALPLPSANASSPVAGLPADHHRTAGAVVDAVDPRYDARQEARVAQQMQALIEAAAPVPHDEVTKQSAAFAVTPEEGLRQMAESTGMTVDARALQPYSRADFVREAAPADTPQP